MLHCSHACVARNMCSDNTRSHSAGGKTMFYSHLPEAYGLTPYVVHSTFQRYNNAGKVARFREAGAYVLDDPEYFTEGNFLVYDNLVLEYMEAIERLVHGNLTQVIHPSCNHWAHHCLHENLVIFVRACAMLSHPSNTVAELLMSRQIVHQNMFSPLLHLPTRFVTCGIVSSWHVSITCLWDFLRHFGTQHWDFFTPHPA